MHINIGRNKRSIEFKYFFKDKLFSHELHLPDDCEPLDDSLFRIAIFTRPENATKYFISGVSAEKSTRLFFENHYKCEIEVADGETVSEQLQNITDTSSGINLSFSGGFDSLSSLFVTGEKTKLFSQSFGGKFQREADFFSLFNTNVFKWDLRGERYNQSVVFNEALDWRFMLSPLLCYRKFNQPFIISTGTIIESSPYWYSSSFVKNFTNYSNSGFGPNVALLNPVSSISEYSTTYLSTEFLSSEMLAKCLESVASVGTLKRYRKETLLGVVFESSIPDAPQSMPRHSFGNGLTDDILSLYLVWKLGYDWVKFNYCENIPLAAKFIDMSFIERVNTRSLNSFDLITKNSFIKKFSSRGLKFYEENDYKRLEQSLELRNSFLMGKLS